MMNDDIAAACLVFTKRVERQISLSLLGFIFFTQSRWLFLTYTTS